ncbi:membrane protein DedA with SNARE-associated domain [Acinetobacter calcoaceticus]|uniref:Membrane protein DedA with SNARE-associated domain n=1 Tax=Acinetobacter calcoaceticus TaxID=471 RepID=A0A4R1Y9T9_ACICA|nr:membrane protein DedA with SNARE-associated domain [Acinetobacter calcoaceticus]
MDITNWVISIMEKLGYLGIALLMFLDNVFPPIPSEVIMPTAGYAASQGQLLFTGVVIAGCIGSLVAAACLYWLGHACDNQGIYRWIDRYGKYLYIKSKDVEKALEWFNQYGERIVFWGRMIPAVRSLISIPAGMSGMPFWKFMLYSGLGTIIWTTFLASVGYYFGENKLLMQQIFSQVGYVIIAIAIIAVAIYVYLKMKKNKANT